MASRRSVSAFDDAPAMETFIDDADVGATDEVALGPLSVCLLCGSSPPKGGDCPHDEIAHFEEAPAEVHAVVARLRAAALARKQQERALRQLVSRAVDLGGVDLVTTPPPAAAPTLCARCQAPTEEPAPAVTPAPAAPPPVTTRRGSRKRNAPLDQGSFFFLEPPPAAADELPKEQPSSPSTDDAPAPLAVDVPPVISTEESSSLRARCAR